MPGNTLLSIALLVGGFALAGFVFLMILSPVIALLYLVVWLLACTILWFTWPPLARAVHEVTDRQRQRIRQRRQNNQSGTQLVDVSFHVNYQLVNLRDKKEAYPVDREEFLIGRSGKNRLVIKNNPAVSASHCRIVYRKYSQEYYIEDLNSDSGTYVGSRRLEPYKQEKLLPNAEITLAELSYRFCKIS